MASIDRSIDGETIGERDGWVLFIRNGRGSDGWESLKLVHMTGRKGAMPKRSFFLGFNGHRLAGNRDATILHKHYPELAAWVLECAQEASHAL